MTFDLEKTIRYWQKGAKYDLGVADAMLKSKKYPYALFMGHLALEKLLKALVVKKTKTHGYSCESGQSFLVDSGRLFRANPGT